jgi:hypothetical protein
MGHLGIGSTGERRVVVLTCARPGAQRGKGENAPPPLTLSPCALVTFDPVAGPSEPSTPSEGPPNASKLVETVRVKPAPTLKPSSWPNVTYARVLPASVFAKPTPSVKPASGPANVTWSPIASTVPSLAAGDGLEGWLA